MSDRALRVAHVVATVGRSGVESHLTALLPAFDRQEVEPTLFVPGPGPLTETLDRSGVRVEPGAPVRKLAWREARALADRVRGYDVLHAHGPRAAFWAAQVARRAGLQRFVCTVHELRWRTLPPGPKRTLWVAFEDWALAQADALIVLSRDSEARVREHRPDWADRLRLVPSSAPLLLEPGRIAPARPGESSGPLRVVSVGRFAPVKRHDRLLKALAIATSRGVAMELHLGGDGELEPALRAQADALGVASRVHWLGGTFNVAATLAGAHVFATASESETFGIAALEAMAVGLPIVTIDNGGVSELVDPDVCGTIVRATRDPAAAAGLADALCALAADPARRAAWGEAAALRARSVFSPAAMARATASVYRGERRSR